MKDKNTLNTILKITLIAGTIILICIILFAQDNKTNQNIKDKSSEGNSQSLESKNSTSEEQKIEGKDDTHKLQPAGEVEQGDKGDKDKLQKNVTPKELNESKELR